MVQHLHEKHRAQRFLESAGAVHGTWSKKQARQEKGFTGRKKEVVWLGERQLGKNPAFQYYPKDWRSDPVWCCSLAARGLWHEMMDRMHESKQYGYLSANGKAIPSEQIARLCGTTLEEYQTLLAELDVLGVPRRTASGIIFCKRMVEDERQRSKWRKQQRKHRVTRADISGLSAHSPPVLHSPSPIQNHTPLPPASGGIQFFEWAHETIEVLMGRKKRLPNLSVYHGARATDVVEFLSRKGFVARIVTTQ